MSLDNECERARALLKQALENALKKDIIEIGLQERQNLDTIINRAESSKGVLAVIITSLVKKIIDLNQDIRLHQDKMEGGYSGRTLDTKAITPFLKSNQFPAMAESGWLTRSLEQSSPYNLDYKGAIRPPQLKAAFLETLDKVEKKDLDPQIALEYLLSRLLKARDEKITFKLSKPVGLSIQTIVSYLHKHFSYDYKSSGASRLPVLAIYAAYKQMMEEVSRYKNAILEKLKPHTSADRRAGTIGDVQVLDVNGRVFEAVEIKHGKSITPSLIREAYEKFKTQPVQRYYLLTTSDVISSSEDITNEIVKISKEHGCQVVINGVFPTLKYYLRLLKNPDDFVSHYVELVECEAAIKFEHRKAWNDIVTEAI